MFVFPFFSAGADGTFGSIREYTGSEAAEKRTRNDDNLQKESHQDRKHIFLFSAGFSPGEDSAGKKQRMSDLTVCSAAVPA